MKNWIISLGLLIASCTSQEIEQVVSITELADRYYEEFISTYPQYSYFTDIPLNDHSLYGSNSMENLKNWEDFEDSLYAELKKVNESKIMEKAERITYWVLKEELESSIDMRVCKRNLWDVNHMFGIHHIWAYLSEFQPVGNDTLRSQAFDRWKKLPQIIDNEIKNLNTGISEGYTMPKEIVELVISQVQTLTGYSLDDSPFMSPARRDETENFKGKWADLVVEVVNPAFNKYENYLQTEYLKKARNEVSILAIPHGSDCYRAFIRRSTTTSKTGEEIFNLGYEIVSNNMQKIEELGHELYQSSDFAEIIGLIESDSGNYFESSDEILEFNRLIMDSAKSRCLNWFEYLPSTEVKIKPYLPHESGIGGYEQAKGDNPAYFRINLNNPSGQTYYENERLSFHEAYPGHHLQIGIEKDIQGLHPIRKLIGFGSYAEGWARYSEQLSEEMGLYNIKASFISRRAWPSRGMVADPALHIKRWSKDSVRYFMMESGLDETTATSLYYRMIVSPAQLTSYDVGGEEFKALRSLAEEKLGDSFSIKEFHSKVLENGSIPLSSLRSVVEEWIENKLNTSKDILN